MDDIFRMGLKIRCNKFCEDQNQFAPINNQDELR